jgi:DNA-binding beta-propeller fold protein YncE
MSNINFFRAMQKGNGGESSPSSSLDAYVDLSPPFTIVSAGTFKPDGTRFYGMCTSGTPSDSLFEWKVPTAWDVTSIVETDYTSSTDSDWDSIYPAGIAFKPDGLSCYVFVEGNTNANKIYQHTLTTAWDINTIIASSSFGLVGNTTSATTINLNFNSSGTKAYVVEDVNGNIVECNLSTAWEISTLSYNQSLDVSSELNPRSLTFTNGGTKMYVMGKDPSNTSIERKYLYTLSTAYDISTASPINYEVIASGWSAVAIQFKTDLTKFYLLRQTTEYLEQYSV